ncbi:unnamed protein product [Ranitomeya imitator]|uniref:Tribbles homolog 2 n=1 Tax=Ranitomeya imitator TaxID=111125 RepID=A0ABN9LV83_9NEOB|nr:unnamed protein product [Ranitomeya imitator]
MNIQRSNPISITRYGRSRNKNQDFEELSSIRCTEPSQSFSPNLGSPSPPETPNSSHCVSCIGKYLLLEPLEGDHVFRAVHLHSGEELLCKRQHIPQHFSLGRIVSCGFDKDQKRSEVNGSVILKAMCALSLYGGLYYGSIGVLYDAIRARILPYNYALSWVYEYKGLIDLVNHPYGLELCILKAILGLPVVHVFDIRCYQESLAPCFCLPIHSNINQIAEIILGETKAYVFFAKSHGDMHSFVRTCKKLKEEEAARLFYQIVSAVAHCHDGGVVLRDLKLRKFVFNDEER